MASHVIQITTHYNWKGFIKIFSYLERHKDYKSHHYKMDDGLREKIGREWEFAFKEFGYEI